MNSNEQRLAQALCLAAVVESALVVDELARSGTAPDAAVECLLRSLFQFEWNSIAEVYGGVIPLRRGLGVLQQALEQVSDSGRAQVLRYVLMLLRLGRKLACDRERLKTIRERLLRIASDTPFETHPRDRLSRALAELYQETISTYPLRIKVNGDAAQLRNEKTAGLIRAILLAGLRATVLWRHVGGSATGLLFSRSALLHACRELTATG